MFTVNWGPRAGFANTGTLQSVFELIDFMTGEGDGDLISFGPSAFLISGTRDGQTITFRVNGSGFSREPSGDLADTGTMTSIEFFAGVGANAGQRIGVTTFSMAIATLNGAIDSENTGNIRAIEDLFASYDWVYNGTNLQDSLTATTSSIDGVWLNMEGDDLINLAGGNDSVFAGNGDDTVNGGFGFDTIFGGNGDDLIRGGELADLLFGSRGNDSLVGGAGFDVLNGNEGDDTLDGGSSPDRLYGSLGNDLLMAGSNFGLTVDGLFGGWGDDTLYGQAGYDLLEGDDGDDYLDGGNQADNLLGGQGEDTMYGGQGLDRLFGGDGNDIGFGGVGTDGMFGERGNDTLYGEDGNDRFFAGQGDDMAFGGADNDTIYGGAGFDTVDGGTGNDILQGNFNADVFVFADGHGNDTVSDFDANNDRERIDLSSVTAITSFADLDANHFSTVTGGVLIDTGGGNSIMLNGVTRGDLDMADFIF